MPHAERKPEADPLTDRESRTRRWREDDSSKKSESVESKTDEDEKSGEGTSSESIGFSSISDMQSATDVVWGKQDDISRQEIIDAAKAEGMEVTFGDDGSMTIVDADGSVFVQNPDGSWTEKDEDGSVSQLGGSWPSNEFTKLSLGILKESFFVYGLRRCLGKLPFLLTHSKK